MTDQELRALVRDAVARHMGPRAAAAQAPAPMPVVMAAGPRLAASGAHPSHALYITLTNVDDACVIEPSVACNHCNYCKSHGH